MYANLACLVAVDGLLLVIFSGAVAVFSVAVDGLSMVLLRHFWGLG